MATCPALSTGDAFLSALLSHIDCQGRTIGAAGYQLLADPGSPLALVLTALLTIFVALFGLRMMLGETPTLRDGVMAVVKIGVVLTFATSWPAYRTVVYDVVVDGPAQLGAAVGGSARLPGARDDLIGRLQAADVTINRLINLGTGRSDVTALTPPGDTLPGQPPRRTPIPDDPAFGTARVLFLSSTVAAFAVVRLTAGLLLALAPLFAGLLLFGVSRGVVVGWARALVFALLASTAVTILLGVELALLEPWLAEVTGLRQARTVTASAPVELLILCLGFALAMAGSLAVILRLAFTVDLPMVHWRGIAAPAPLPTPSERVPAPSPQPGADRPAPRAHAVADALFASQRREQMSHAQTSSRASAAAPLARAGAAATADDFTIPASGQTLRRTRPRASLGAALRDRRS
ncbi:MAG: type IV secretion system protein [Brevundimonas sp.]|uniref:type IV secretion system protein n=1 Tax=Brevundimonas sp. TaxID=1871086 RepID=UPI002487DB9D|nr:type IV secretion system protein [Brevundimonas sp.]MDI1325561.1 type IV secretion system protein [Brevundimonas sp.]